MGSREESKVAGFFEFPHIRRMGYIGYVMLGYRLSRSFKKIGLAGSINRRIETVKIRINP